MDDMLLELSKLAPPTSCPPSDSQSEEESNEGEDSLTLLRRRLEEPAVTVQPPTPTVTTPAADPMTTPTLGPEATPISDHVATPLKPSPAGSGYSTPKFSPGRNSPVSKVRALTLSEGRLTPHPPLHR